VKAELLAEAINRGVRGAVVSVNDNGMPSVTVSLGRLVAVCSYLKTDLGFNYLASVTGVDFYDRFEVIYHLHVVPSGEEACLKVIANHNDPVVPSVFAVWQGADFQEREVYDLMGIRFSGHPKLKRILMWEEFQGHPLRKDFGMGDQAAWQQMPHMPELET
jgi:NADH-quinone oxidoreductase subunit C